MSPRISLLLTIASESSNTNSPDRELTKQMQAHVPTRKAAAGYGSSATHKSNKLLIGWEGTSSEKQEQYWERSLYTNTNICPFTILVLADIVIYSLHKCYLTKSYFNLSAI